MSHCATFKRSSLPYILEATSSLRKYYKLLVMIPTGAQSDYCHRTTSYTIQSFFSASIKLCYIFLLYKPGFIESLTRP